MLQYFINMKLLWPSTDTLAVMCFITPFSQTSIKHVVSTWHTQGQTEVSQRLHCLQSSFTAVLQNRIGSWSEYFCFFLTAVERHGIGRLDNHNSGGHEKVSQADLALRPASITSLTVTSEISLHYQHTSKEACEPLTLHHPFISPHTRSSLADVNFRLLICVLWEYEYVRICFLWEYELPLLFLHK